MHQLCLLLLKKFTICISDKNLINEKNEEIGNRLIEIISEVRKEKSKKSLSLKEPVKEIILPFKESEIKDFIEDLKSVTKAEKISFGKELQIKL